MSGLLSVRERFGPGLRRRLVAVLSAVVVAAGLVLAGAQVATAQGYGTFGGTLSLPDGSPADGATVAFEPVDGSPAVTSTTDQQGEFFVGVPSGQYRVHFTRGTSSSYAYRQRAAEDARVFTVQDGEILTVNDTLLANAQASISGVVRDAAGRGIGGVCVRRYPADFGNDETDPTLCTDPDRFGVLTAADGSFTVTGLEQGEYGLDVADPAGRYVRATVKSVSVGEGENVTGVVVTLAAAGSVSGVAVDGRTGKALEGICPQAYPGRRATGTPLGQATCSGADGRWSVTGLAPLRYTVRLVGDATHAQRFVGGGGSVDTARLLTVVAGRDLGVGRVQLFAGATLTGRVTDSTGAPVAGAWVTVGLFNAAAGPGDGQYTAQTDAAGRYRITNVPQMREIATVYVQEQPYAWQWSGGATDPARARPLTFRYERTTTYDVVLQPEATLTVKVEGLADGQDLDVRALTGSGLSEVGFGGFLTRDGDVVLRNLPDGVVTVRGARFTEPVLTFWYDGASTQKAATKVRVAPGRTTSITLKVPAGS